MTPVITGMGVRSPLASSPEALFDALVEGTADAWTHPPYAGEGLANPLCAAMSGRRAASPATELLHQAVADALAHAGSPAAHRVGLVVGTSSGDICGPWERWHQAAVAGSDPGPEPTRDGPTRAVARQLGLGGPIATVSVACISSTAAFLVAASWLREGRCDAVVVAGVDALSLFVHAGFGGLGALSASRPMPFSAERDGLLLGEAAAALLLEPESRAGARGIAALLGCGMAGDATHMTAPARDGRGAAASLRAALTDAGLRANDVDAVSLHATGTVFNDAMESAAVATVFGRRSLAFHGIKHLLGHTLGAAGAVEAVVCAESIRRGTVPPPPPSVGADCPLRHEPRPPRVVASMSSAFAGANAAIVLGTPDHRHPARSARPVQVVANASVEVAPDGWADAWPDAPERLWRSDSYTRIVLLAAHRVAAELDLPEPTAIVLASMSNCRQADIRYHEGLLRRGASRASRKAFAATIPGAPVGALSIELGLRGPALTLVAGPDAAHDEAARLVRWGHAAAAIAVHAEAPSPDRVARAQVWVISRVP